MILRLSQKLKTKIKAGKLVESPLDENPFADWSCHLFTARRKQYIILSNTASLYSCVMSGKRITNESRFIESALSTIREFMEQQGKAEIYQRLIAPSTETINFAKAHSRKVTGSMNELVMAATYALELGEETLQDLGTSLNDFLLSAIATKEDRGYAKPNEAFQRLLTENDA